MTSDLLTPSTVGLGGTSYERKTPSLMDTPLNRGGHIVQSKPHRLVGTNIQDSSPQAKLEYAGIAGHSTPGQAKSELGHVKSEVETPAVPGPVKATASSEEARKLRQAQKKLRQEQWKKKHGGAATSGCVVTSGGVAPGLGHTPDSDQIAAMKKYEMELVSNDDPVFWDRIMLSQECSSSPSAVVEGALGEGEGGGGGADTLGVWLGAQPEEHLTESVETTAKRFKSGQ